MNSVMYCYLPNCWDYNDNNKYTSLGNYALIKLVVFYSQFFSIIGRDILLNLG